MLGLLLIGGEAEMGQVWGGIGSVQVVAPCRTGPRLDWSLVKGSNGPQ